jgi:hypothetical protein
MVCVEVDVEDNLFDMFGDRRRTTASLKPCPWVFTEGHIQLFEESGFWYWSETASHESKCCEVGIAFETQAYVDDDL